jgi:hypothetical protein
MEGGRTDHVGERLAAHGARVLGVRVELVARGVHEVAALRLPYGRRRREEVLVADRAVALQPALAAPVAVRQRQRHALVAPHAVEHVDAQPLHMRKTLSQDRCLSPVAGETINPRVLILDSLFCSQCPPGLAYCDQKVANRESRVWHFVIENGY